MPRTYASRHASQSYPGPYVSEGDKWELSQPYYAPRTFYRNPQSVPVKRKSPSLNRVAANVRRENLKALEKKRRSLLNKIMKLFRLSP